MQFFYNWIEQFRIYHWSKNIVIFLPLVAVQEYSIQSFSILISIFLLFSFFVSGTYIINDFFDLKSDKLHKIKKLRPLASKRINVNNAILVSFFLLSTCLVICYYKFSLDIVLIFLLYLILSLTYSKIIKKIPILDILVLSLFYLIRLWLGGLAIDVSISVWLFTFCFFIFLPLCCIKRIIEINKFNKKSIRGYGKNDISFLNNISNSSSLLSLIVILLYAESTNFKVYYNNIYFLFIISLIIIFWMLRVNRLANKGLVSHDPVLFALKDKLTYFLTFIAGILLIINS